MPSRPVRFASPRAVRAAAAARIEAEAARGSARERGYSRAWDKASAGWRRLYPLCLGCAALGEVALCEVVDHIVPHKGDYALFWDSSNWQPACRWHHDVVKQALEGAWARGACTVADLRLDSPRAVAVSRLRRGGGG